eukprot:315807-Pelagomonas_calceolata.AAC.2
MEATSFRQKGHAQPTQSLIDICVIPHPMAIMKTEQKKRKRTNISQKAVCVKENRTRMALSSNAICL